jgi:hypothetical protein
MPTLPPFRTLSFLYSESARATTTCKIRNEIFSLGERGGGNNFSGKGAGDDAGLHFFRECVEAAVQLSGLEHDSLIAAPNPIPWS